MFVFKFTAKPIKVSSILSVVQHTFQLDEFVTIKYLNGGGGTQKRKKMFEYFFFRE